MERFLAGIIYYWWMFQPRDRVHPRSELLKLSGQVPAVQAVQPRAKSADRAPKGAEFGDGDGVERCKNGLNHVKLVEFLDSNVFWCTS